MRKTRQLGMLAVVSSLPLLTGCLATGMSPVMGGLYTKVDAPYSATANTVGQKVGTAFCTSVLGLIATGDCSITTAAKNGGITKVSHVDYSTEAILGLYAKVTVKVYGQ